MTDNGQLPFEGDTFIAVEILKLKTKFNIGVALETGSQYGSTLGWLTQNFRMVIGCEPNADFYNIAKTSGLVANIKSIEFLKMFIDSKERVFIFIDSHWSGELCPLKLELEIIAKFKQKPVIAIHDFKVPDHSELGYDIHDFELRFEEIEPYLKKIYKNGFNYHYNEQANGAMRGIIYIYPKL